MHILGRVIGMCVLHCHWLDWLCLFCFSQVHQLRHVSVCLSYIPSCFLYRGLYTFLCVYIHSELHIRHDIKNVLEHNLHVCKNQQVYNTGFVAGTQISLKIFLDLCNFLVSSGIYIFHILKVYKWCSSWSGACSKRTSVWGSSEAKRGKYGEIRRFVYQGS